jgi:predicted transcriptional regulator
MSGKNESGSGITSVAEKELGLLSRHLDVLKTVRNHGPIGIIRLSPNDRPTTTYD